MIWDCVLYNGETELLDIRMTELAEFDVVHVLIEGRQTFQGNPKPVTLIERERVIHHVIDIDIHGCECGCAEAIRFTPSDAWVREAHQRNAVLDVLRPMAASVDLVLLGDVDEVPAADILLDLQITPCRFLMDAYFFDYEWFGGHHIPCTVATAMGQITTPAQMRHADMCTVDGGWHLTYMGGPEAIMRKIASFSHSELTVHPPEVWEQAIRTGVVPWTGVQLAKADRSKLPRSLRYPT